MLTDADFDKWDEEEIAEQQALSPAERASKEENQQRMVNITEGYKSDLASGKTDLLPEENIDSLDHVATEEDINYGFGNQRGIGER